MIALITLLQCFIYDHDPLTLLTSVSLFLAFSFLLFLALGSYILVLHNSTEPPVYPDWIDLLYLLSAFKITVTCLQNFPQLYLNYLRKSTAGWAIDQIWLDLLGALLSIAQLFIDALRSSGGNWVLNGITGNPAKLGIGAISLLLDVAFLGQHYVLYRDSGRCDERVEIDPPEPGESDALLPPTAVVTVYHQEADARVERLVVPWTIRDELISGPLGAQLVNSPVQSIGPSRSESGLLAPLRRKSAMLDGFVGSMEFRGVSWRDVWRGSSNFEQSPRSSTADLED